MKITCEHLGTEIQVNPYAQRIVSLSSGLTEGLFEMGFGNRVAGVSPYCSRYADSAHLPVAGDYLKADTAVLDEIKPDIILLTSGIQLSLAKQLAGKGYPVYVLPLPVSFWGIAENIVKIAGLCGDVSAGRALAGTMTEDLLSIYKAVPADDAPSVYTEAWFGRHPRMIGASSFIHDIIRLAGSRPLFGSVPFSYRKLDIPEVTRLRPDIFLGFYEPEYHVDFAGLSKERGWAESFSPKIVTSCITKGMNIIHDGPSMVDTVRWIHQKIFF